MNTSDMVKRLAEANAISQKEAKRLLDTAVNIMADHLVQDRGFTIPDLGTFTTVERPPRQAYNPARGEMMELPARKVPVFHPSQTTKDEVKHRSSDHE